jgi:hypothetical protein
VAQQAMGGEEEEAEQAVAGRGRAGGGAPWLWLWTGRSAWLAVQWAVSVPCYSCMPLSGGRLACLPQARVSFRRCCRRRLLLPTVCLCY